MVKQKKEIVSVLSYEKKIVPSSGFMFATTWKNRNNSEFDTPIMVGESTIKGTIGHRLKPAIKNDPMKLNREVSKANIQLIDVCSLPFDHDCLKLKLSIKFIGGIKPSACNNAAFEAKSKEAIDAYSREESYLLLSNRYAHNIAAGRFLWRNRVGAEKIEIKVSTGDSEWIFNGYEYSLRTFADASNNIQPMADMIAKTLSSDGDVLVFNIEACVQIGMGQEVYPSEEFIMDKGAGKKGKVLSQENGLATLHPQKIGNAIRTVDTWYDGYTDSNMGPLAADIYGSVTNKGVPFRSPKTKKDFFTLFDKFASGIEIDHDQRHFVMSVLIRGGVFSDSGRG